MTLDGREPDDVSLECPIASGAGTAWESDSLCVPHGDRQLSPSDWVDEMEHLDPTGALTKSTALTEALLEATMKALQAKVAENATRQSVEDAAACVMLEFFTSEAPKPSWRQTVDYYWTGLTNNQVFKHDYLKYCADVREQTVMLDQVFTDTFAALREEREEAEEKDEKMGNEEASNKIAEAYQNDPTMLLDLCLVAMLAVALVVMRCSRALWLAKCPVQAYLEDLAQLCGYFISWRCGFKWETKPTGLSLPCIVMGNKTQVLASMAQSMGEFVKMAVDLNDQLPFKAFLVTINLLTFLGQYLYNTVINPQKTYKCIM